MNNSKVNSKEIQNIFLNEIEKNSGIKNYNLETNLFDPTNEQSLDPIDLVYIFTEVFSQLPISMDEVLTNYSFDKFSIKGISELIIEKID